MSGLHVAIIMDGNGRWARARGLPRWRGHIAGAEAVREIVRAAPDLGISVLTLYAFSSDNWKRPAREVGRIFWLLRDYCRRETEELVASGVRLTAIGRRDRIPRSALRSLEAAEAATAGGKRLLVRLAIDYSSRYEIARATAELVLAGRDASESEFSLALTGGVPDPDLVIRTAGEKRVSDFLLWEIAYSEFHFAERLWPDFAPADLSAAVHDYELRDRRYGGLVAVRGAGRKAG